MNNTQLGTADRQITNIGRHGANKMPTSMSTGAASRIQSAGARSGGGGVSKGSFASRAQRAAARNSRSGDGRGGGGFMGKIKWLAVGIAAVWVATRLMKTEE